MKNKWLIIGVGVAVVLCVVLFIFGPDLFQLVMAMHGA